MRIGKLTNSELEQVILSKITHKRDDIVLGPGIGIDCGGIAFGDDVCMLSCDPITASSKDAGSLAVNVSCNDIAATGATPIGLLVTMLIPPKCHLDEVQVLFEQIVKTAGELDVELLGGHTEITDSVNRIVICTTAVGKAENNRFVTAKGAQIGDSIIMTKFAGIEGTAIIANDFPDRVSEILTDEQMDKCKSLTAQTSVVREGRVGLAMNATSMHDVTEGGILGAIHEVCTASGCGALINIEKIPILIETRLICKELHIDPLRLISSGCMMITVTDGQSCVDALMGEGIPATIIGKIKEGSILGVYRDSTQIIEPPDRDEIYKLFIEN